jgi:EAL domain-containing protein (putative c-di-GMP-specific phosphodiesterase class I)
MCLDGASRAICPASRDPAESLLIRDTAAVLERLLAIRSLGVNVSLDDFGTGYSSLAYLQKFPMSHLRIDRSFVTPLDAAEEGPGLAAAIIEIGRALGMSTVAEGIETEGQRDRLRSMGCTHGQGYLFGRPQEAERFVELLGKPPASVAAWRPSALSLGGEPESDAPGATEIARPECAEA